MASNFQWDIDVPELQQAPSWDVSQRQDSLTRLDPTESLVYYTQTPNDYMENSEVQGGMQNLRKESKGKEKVMEPEESEEDRHFLTTNHVAAEVDLCQDGPGRALTFMDRETHSDQKRFEEVRMIAELQQFFGFSDTENANLQRSDYQTDWDNELREETDWETEKQKAKIVAHPLYPDLMAAHVACQRVVTPMDQTPYLDWQLAQAQAEATNKYCVVYRDELDTTPEEKAELDVFMVHDIMLITAYKDQLQQRLNGAVREAMMFCWNTEQELYKLTGASPVYGKGAATVSDKGAKFKGKFSAGDPNLDYTRGFGPVLRPTETDHYTNVERLRQELMPDLKEAYRKKLFAIREEILRTGRVGELPEGSTTVLRAWWRAHIECPYPTEDEKERFSRQTGLPLKLVNNWFINQRKRNWHGINHHFAASSSERITKQKLSCEFHVESGLGSAGPSNLQPMATANWPSSSYSYNLRPEEQWPQDFN